jgi:cation transporter-like permease
MTPLHKILAAYLRARAFERFGYDPDQVFSP